MHSPDFSGEAKFARPCYGNGTFMTTDEGNGGGVEEAGEGLAITGPACTFA